MAQVPDRHEYDTLALWIDATAQEIDIQPDLLWDIVEQFKPGARAMTGSEKEQRLHTLFQHHYDNLTAAGDDPGTAPFINIYFSVDGETDSHYQFSWGMYNFVNLNDTRREILHSLIEDEDLLIEIEEDSHFTAADYEWTPEEALRVTGRILEEVYDSSFEEIERATQADGVTGEEVAWTDI